MSIEIKNLRHVYSIGTPFEVEALRDVSLTIEAGEFTAIIGQTGSGKSTLIQHLNGLLKPTSGQVVVNGIDVADKKMIKKVRQQVGLVFQFPEHQLFEETVRADISFGPKNMGLSVEEIEKRAYEALYSVGLSEDLMDRSPFDLSGGQMRRVAIAGVLAMKPKFLILDEPTAGLDPRGRNEVLSLVQSLHEKEEMTVILVSHNMEDVARIAKRLVVMHGGKVFRDGPPAQVFSDAHELQQIGLDVPQVTRLMHQLRTKGFSLPEVALTVNEAKDAILSALKMEGVESA